MRKEFRKHLNKRESWIAVMLLSLFCALIFGIWLSSGANSSVNLTSNTSLTFTAKYGQEVWMNLETRGFDLNFNRVDWSITPTSLLTVKNNSGSNNANSFSAGDGSGGYLRGKSTASIHSTAWIRWEFKPTTSTSTSSSCCTITIHNYRN